MYVALLTLLAHLLLSGTKAESPQASRTTNTKQSSVSIASGKGGTQSLPEPQQLVLLTQMCTPHGLLWP